MLAAPVKFLTELFKYGLVGILTVITQSTVYIAMATYLRLSGLAAYTLAVLASLVVAYFGQSRWTFVGGKSRSVWKFLVVVLTCFCIGSASTWAIVDWGELPPYWALPVIAVFIPLTSFLMLRSWAFR